MITPVRIIQQDIKHFEEGFDFCIIRSDNTRYDGGFSHREQIETTLDCAKKKLVKHFDEDFDYQLRRSAELRPQGGFSRSAI